LLRKEKIERKSIKVKKEEKIGGDFEIGAKSSLYCPTFQMKLLVP
jgi:hypothetical protein